MFVLRTASAIAVVPPDGALLIDTVGISPYSSPASTTVIALNELSARIAVAIPPDPNTFTLLIVTVGVSVYPYPGFVIKI